MVNNQNGGKSEAVIISNIPTKIKLIINVTNDETEFEIFFDLFIFKTSFSCLTFEFIPRRIKFEKNLC